MHFVRRAMPDNVGNWMYYL